MKSYNSKQIHVEEKKFNLQLRQCRKAFEEAKIITPNLVVIKLHDQSIPCYIDQLDNGMELMFFPNESCFTYSIMNSMNEDPDLLFTNAWTIDFLYKTCEDTDLYVSDDKNLCFRNLPGCLPKTINNNDMNFLNTCLQQIIFAFENKQIPCLTDHKMGIINNYTYFCKDFAIQEKQYTLSLQSHDYKLLTTIPHTNEHILLSIIALPKADSEYTKQLRIRFVAQTKHNHKEMNLALDSMEGIIDQLYSFFMELFKERGIPEAFHIHNKNIANILSMMCQSLDIACVINSSSCAFGDYVLQMILQDMEEKEINGFTSTTKKDTTRPLILQKRTSYVEKETPKILS